MVDSETLIAGPVSFAGLGTRDLDTVFALHRAAIDAVGRPDLIKPESLDFFQRILSGGGRIIGAFGEHGLVGYGVLQLDLPPSEDARLQLGLSSPDRLAKLAGASVLPHAWGEGIHDALIRLRVEEAQRLALGHLYATAAPGNARSWQNLLDAGFMVRGLIQKYGGHLRYLLYRDLASDAETTGQGVWCGADEIERQLALAAAGWSGVRWRKRQDGTRELWYRAPA